MIAFAYCDRRCPDKTEILWAASATEALSQACKALKAPALRVELERVPYLDGRDQCPEDQLDRYRLMMMDKFPMTEQPAKSTPDESVWWTPSPVPAKMVAPEPDPVPVWHPLDDLPKWERSKPKGEKKKASKNPALDEQGRDEWGRKA